MPYPYRTPRCSRCMKEAVMTYSGEPYCSIHTPYREMSEEYTRALYDLLGKDTRDKLIDEKFPDDFSDWGEYYAWAKDMVERLSFETGLLLLL